MNKPREAAVYFRLMKAFLRKLAAPCAALALVSSTALAAEGWGEDYAKALAEAKSEKKLVLLDFTGSDWCGWCIRLNKEVFSKTEFKDYAAKNLVLVEVDFPRSKAQSAELKAQNDKLQKQFKIEGYPTIIVLNSAGKKVGELGYEEGGPAAFTKKLDALKGK
jgi:protein disulfide-isomerase